MTKIHVITRENRHLYMDIMQSYFRIRHDIFVGERKWTALEKANRLEYDEYDNEHTIYLLALEGERVVGGQRLYPTLLPHMISEAFSQLVETNLPVGRRIFEWSRYFIIRERRRTHVDAMLMAAVQQYCLEHDITDVTAVGEMWWLPRWHQYGFEVHPLGLPQTIESQPTLAVRISVSESTYASVLRVGGLRPTALRTIPTEDSVIELQDAA